MRSVPGVLRTTKRTRYTPAALVLRAPSKLGTMDSPVRTFFRSLADYTVGTVIVVAQLALFDRRGRGVPALAAGARR